MARARTPTQGPPTPAPEPDEATPLQKGAGSVATERSIFDLRSVKRAFRENDKALSYTILTTLATVPTLLFGSLHMVAFLDMHHITTMQVAGAHVIFMVWNTLNDVFAGYSSDWYAARVGTRLGLVCVVQAVWVATIFGPFVPVPGSMTQGIAGSAYYLACISLQDGCLSIVGVARTALMQEITTTEGECIHLKRLNAILGCTEALVNLGGYALWNPSRPWPFLGYLFAISCVALLANFWSAARLREHTGQEAKAAKQCQKPALPPILVFVRSMPRNAWVFIGITALHEMQGVAWGQFAIPLMEALLVDVAKFWRVLLLGGLSSVAGVIAFLMTWPAERTGLYSVLLWTFRLKAVLALLLGSLIAALGLSNALVGLCMLLNECSMAMLSGFRLVVLVSVLDELAAQRSAGGPDHPLAAYPGACGAGLLVGVSAFFAKPFNSVGPVLGTALLAGDGASGPDGKMRAVALLAALPLVTGLGQWLLWSRFFTLRGRPAVAGPEPEQESLNHSPAAAGERAVA